MKMTAKVLGLEKLTKSLALVDAAGREGVLEGLEKSAILVHGTAVKLIRQRSMGREYKRGSRIHIASKPGDPPNVDTGELLSGVKWEMDKKAYVSAVGTNVDHGVYMEFGTSRVAARPWLGPAVKLCRREIAGYMRVSLQSAIRRVAGGK